MKREETLRRLCVGVGLAVATAAPAFAAPMFGAATYAGIADCNGINTPGGSLSATPVNGGAGVILSGSASVTGDTSLCMILEWRGAMSGPVDAVTDIPIAWDVLTSVTDPADPAVSTDIYIEISHQAYPVGQFNQVGFAYSTSQAGAGPFTSPPNLSLTWPGPPPGTPRDFTSYYVRMLVLYENLGSTLETFSIDIPTDTSIDLGDVRRNVVPEPAIPSLFAAGLAGLAWRRRATA
jgi:hypothetical protein